MEADIFLPPQFAVPDISQLTATIPPDAGIQLAINIGHALQEERQKLEKHPGNVSIKVMVDTFAEDLEWAASANRRKFRVINGGKSTRRL
jgi:hypothetical protein